MKKSTIASTLALTAALTVAFAISGSRTGEALNLGKIGGAVKDSADVVQAFTIGDKEEVEIGSQIHPQLLEEMGGVYKDATVQNYVNNIGQKLVKASTRKNIPYHFTVVNADYVNAFAIPGGYVYVTKGILAMMKDEAELAAVIGHEIGHVTEKHGVNRIKQAVAIEKGAKYSGKLGGEVAKKLTNIFANLAATGYGRGQELEADKVGLVMANKANYDPNGAVRLFEHFLDLEKKGPKAGKLDKFLSSHPDTKKRVAKAKEEIKGLKKKGRLVNQPQYARVRSRLKG